MFEFVDEVDHVLAHRRPVDAIHEVAVLIVCIFCLKAQHSWSPISHGHLSVMVTYQSWSPISHGSPPVASNTSIFIVFVKTYIIYNLHPRK